MSLVRLCAAMALTGILAATPQAKAADAWQEPQDSAEAINNPDKYAWRLFVALNWPAEIAQKKADPNKKFGDAAPGPVVWETWRSARNDADDTAFPRNGADPGPWLGRAASPQRLISDFDNRALQQVIRRDALQRRNRPAPLFDDEMSARGLNETRLNKDAYEFIREKKLYNAEEQIKLFTSGKASISFPVNAKEIKAQWRKIKNEDKPRYHWVEVRESDQTAVYGLTALHITTKDLPNWFWATFEHVDNEKTGAEGGHPGSEGWLLPSRDSVACANGPLDCNAPPPAGFGLQDTKWQNYRLRGTQVDFTSSEGKTLLLANSQPEQSFQTSSSCIACHSRATINSTGRLSVFKCIDANDSVIGEVGSPNQKWFVEADGRRKFTQLDFVWSLFRAQKSDGRTVNPAGEPDCPAP